MATHTAMSAGGWERRWLAPAKVNLALHIVGRRPDGYHLLQTIFQLIDLCDVLDFAPCAEGAIRRAVALAGVSEDDDLTLRAARLLQATVGCRAGVTIRVEKRIPIGGGLGGGSSDAATVLLALNALWQTQLARDELARLALQLGADVPFFILGRNAYAEGIGEVLTPLALGPAWYVVVTPQVTVSTKEIFAAPELTRHSKPLTISALLTGPGRNDLEPAVRARFPEVARALEWLSRYGDARMSGSGSSVFATFATEVEARKVAAEIPEEWRAYAVRSLDRHPLAED